MVSILSVGVGAGTVIVHNVQIGAMNVRLAEDVAQVNTAISIYETGGGSLEGLTDAQAVVDKLKTVTRSDNKNDREIMFLKRSMVDPRLEVVTSLEGRSGFWRWGRKYVRYDATRHRFELLDSQGTGTFHGFALNDELGTSAVDGEGRSMMLKQSKESKWVWDYNKDVTLTNSQPPQSLTGMETNGGGGAPSAGGGAVQALPPVFDPLPPQPSLNSYPLSVTLTNPNNTAVSRILYHLEPGPGIDAVYSGSIPVDPAVKVVAYVQSLDTTIYTDSQIENHTYTPDPVTLDLDDTIQPTYTYVELGGPMAAGSPNRTPVPPGRITLVNQGDIPNLYQNDSTFRMLWTYNGTDPLTDPSATAGTSFFNGYQGDAVPVALQHFGETTAFEVRYAGRSFNSLITNNSEVNVRAVTAQKIVLPAPLMTLPPGSVEGGPVIISPDVGSGMIPKDYRIYYRVDGQDPGNLNGEPAVGASLYVGPIVGASLGSVVAARVYAPVSYKNWFDPSPVSTLEIGNPMANQFYAVGGSSNIIYVFDSTTGNNLVKTSSALFPIECLAADSGNTAVYYIEKADANWRLGRYDVMDGTHKDLGRLTDGYLNGPVSQPTNLMYFNDGLYYLHENTDDLIKIELTQNGAGISEQFRVADLTGDAVAFTAIGDLATNSEGKLYISASNAFATYDMRKMGDFTLLQGTPTHIWTGLVIGGAQFFGVSADNPDQVQSIDPATGDPVAAIDFAPVRDFWDFAGPQPRVQTEPVGGQHYFVTNGQTNIYRLDLATGRDYLVTTLLPMQPTGIAIDRSNSFIYTVGHDDSNRPGDAFLCRFDLTTGATTDLGSLKSPSLAYRADTYPLCLTYFENDLYYVPPATDDLVKIVIGASSLTSQTKVSDLIDNSGTLGELDALTIGPDGWLYLSRSDADLLARYDIVNLTSFTILKNSYEAAYQSLTYDIYGQMHGTFASKPTHVYTVDDIDGASALKFDTQPSISVWDITGMFDARPQPVTKDYFASDGTSARIFRIDPDTGANQVLTLAPWSVDNIAFDADQRRVFYMRRNQFDLGVYSMQDGQHEQLGPINAPALTYKPSQRPANLTCFNGALYFIATDTDDLVKIEINPGGGIGQAYKVSDLTNDTANFGAVGDLAVDANGILFFSSPTAFGRVDMRTMSGFAVLNPAPADSYAGLLFTTGGTLIGTHNVTTSQLHTIDMVTGDSLGSIPNVPLRTFGDLAGPQNRVPVDVPQGVHYFAQNNSSVIRELDITTGANRIITWGAPWNIGGIAYDPESRTIYYTQQPGGDTETHVAKYEVELDRHTDLGSISSPALGFVPGSMPKHLTYFHHDLYYIAPATDDLIKVTLSDSAVLSSEKVADINANNNLGDIGAVTIDNAGWLYFARQNGGLVGKFNLYTLNGYQAITTASTANHFGLTFDASNQLYGFPVADPDAIYSLDSTNGTTAMLRPTVPVVDIWDITGNNAFPPPEIPGNYYAVGGGNGRIYKIDPVTGVNGPVTTTAPFHLRAVARDPDNNVLYYLEDVPSNWRLGKYDLGTATHTILGSLTEPGFQYIASERPTNLFFYGGAVFYIANYTDNLVMIQTDGVRITAQTKVANLTNNLLSLGSVGDVAVDANGIAYASDSTPRLFRFSMKTLGGYAQVTSSLPHYFGLLFTDEEQLFGVQGNAPTSIYSLNKSAGTHQFSAATRPTQTFWDMAGNEVSAPWGKGDSLWAIVEDAAAGSQAVGYTSTAAAPNGAVATGNAAAWNDVRLTYDQASHVLTGSITLDQSALVFADPADQAEVGPNPSWKTVTLAVSDGAAPTHGLVPTHGLFFLDVSSGTPKLSVYRYDFDAAAARANPTVILNATQTSGALSVTDKGALRTFTFSLDVTPVQNALNLPGWEGALSGAALGGRVQAWANPTVGYSAAGQITNWNPGWLSSGNPNVQTLGEVSNAATAGLRGRLVEFRNYRTPLIEKRDWGLISLQDGGALTALTGNAGFEGLTITSDGSAYFVRNEPTSIDGVTYGHPLFRLNVGAQGAGQAAIATFVGDLTAGLVAMGAAATDPVTGVAASPQGRLHGVVKSGDASAPDQLFAIANLLRDTNGQLVNVAATGALAGAGEAATNVEDLSFSSNGTLYVSDDADDKVYVVDPATAMITAVHSEAGGTAYRGLAVNPADEDVTASDGSSNQIMRALGGAANDTPYFDYAARFSLSDIRAIAFFNGSFKPIESTPPYFAIDRTQRIHAVDPVTGETALVTAGAPFPLDAIAYDGAAGALYYIENSDTNFRLGRYTLASNVHTILGDLESGSFSYNPTAHPEHLVFYSGALYYIHPESDDLIRITVVGDAVATQEKVADLNRDNNLGTVQGAALNDAGMLYLANSSVLMKYNLRTLSGYTVILPTFGSFESLLWNSNGGLLHGSASAALTRVDTVGTSTGSVIPGPLTAPAISLYDMVGPNSAVPSSAFDSSLFGVTGGDRAIHIINPTTGQNSVLDNGAPFNVSAVAFDGDNAQLYYLEDTADPGNWRLGRLSVNSSVHTILGNIKSPALEYSPAERPRNLAFFNGDLYYIPKNSDDLVKITIVGSGIASQTKVADLRANAAFTDVGDISVTPGGLAYFTENIAARPVYRYDLANLSGFQSFGTTSRFYDALTWYNGKLYAAGGTTALDALNYIAGLGSAGSVATTPARAFVDLASPVPGVAIGRSGSLWAIAESPSGNLVEFRNYRSVQTVEAIDYGPIYFMDGASMEGLSTSGCRIHSMTVTNTGRLFFVNDEGVSIGGQTFGRSLFHIDLGTIVMGQPIIATFDGDIQSALPGIGSNDRITGLGIGPDGAMYGCYRTGSATTVDTLFRLTSLRVDPSRTLTDVAIIGVMTGPGHVVTEVEDLCFGPDGTLYASDNKTDEIVGVDRATATVGGLFSHETNIDYLGVTIDPADDAMIGTHVAGANEKVMRLVTPGNGPDQFLFNYGNMFGYSRIEAMSFYTRPFVAGEGALYAVTGSDKRIYAINAANGQTTQIDNESPSPAGSLQALAYNAAVHSLLYTDAADSSGHFRLYSYQLVNDTHALIGQLDGGSFAYPVTLPPANLTAINGDLYFVHSQSDDLVRIRYNAGGITSIDKMADLSGDLVDLGSPGDLTVRDDGTLFIAANSKLYRFNLPQLGFFTEVAPSAAGWKAVSFAGGNLLGNRSALPTSIYYINPVDATDVFAAATTPSVNVADFASSEPAVTLPTAPSAPYFGVNGSKTLFTVDPETGGTTVLTSDALFNAAAVACDGTNLVLYYIEDTDVDFRLGRFDITSGQHTNLGNMEAPAFAYAPTQRPHHLAFYNEDLYYINRDSDDLIRVKVSGSSIISQEKVADLNGDLSLNTIMAAAVDDEGILYFSNATSLMRYNLLLGGETTVLKSNFEPQHGLMWDVATGALAGAAVGTQTRIDQVSKANGAVTPGPITVPAVSFIDLTAGNSAPAPGAASYYGVNLTTTIYRVNPLTGATNALPTPAAYAVDSIAYDEAAGRLYVIENTNTNTRLGRYDLASNTFANLGNIRAATWGYVPTERPQHLFFYDGALYYVNYDGSVTAKRDDLIRIVVSDTGIVSQEKVADIAANVGLGRVTAATVDNLGWVYLNPGSQLRKYDLRNGGNLTTIQASSATYSGLLWNYSDNFLYGTISNSNSTRNKLTRISVVNGSSTAQANLTPTVGAGFYDLASGNSAQPPPSLDVPRAYIGGEFADASGNFRNLARLNNDGSLDTAFDTGTGTDGPVRAIARLSNGQVIAGGDFNHYRGVPRHGLVRVNPDGSIDSSFTPLIYSAGDTTEVTLDWANWTTFAQNAGLNGTDPWHATRNAYYGLATDSGGVAGFASQTWNNVSGSGVNMTLYVSQNMTENNDALQAPDMFGDTAYYSGGVNPDRRITGHTALRFTSDQNGGTIAPTTIVASFSEPVYINQAVWGSLSSLGGSNSTTSTNVAGNGGFETGPGWPGVQSTFPPESAGGSPAVAGITASGVVDEWASDRMTWIEDAARAAEGSKFVWLHPSSTGGSYSLSEGLMVGPAAGPGVKLVSGKKYRVTFNWAAFHPYLPQGNAAFTARPAFEFGYVNPGEESVVSQVAAIDAANSQPVAYHPMQAWNALDWRTVTGTFTAPDTSATQPNLGIRILLDKGATGQMSSGANHMSVYNVICFEDFSSTDDIDGKTWIGGNIVSPSWYQMGDQYTAAPNDYVVVVCGTVGGTASGPGINFSGGGNAKLVVKDSASRGARPINWNGGGSQSTRMRVDPSIVATNAAMRADLEQRSLAYASLASNSAVETPSGQSDTRVFHCAPQTVAGQPGVAVFNIAAADLFGNTGVAKVDIDSVTGSGGDVKGVIINVSGSTVDWTSNFSFVGGFATAAWREKVLWNFSQATALAAGSHQMSGAVLAPLAAVTSSNAFDGALVCRSLTTTGECHRVPFLSGEVAASVGAPGGLLIDNVSITEAPTFNGSRFENGYFRAFTTPDATGAPVAADSYANISDRTAPLLGTVADPVTTVDYNNVRMDQNTGDAIYHTIGTGAEEDGRYGRVAFSYNSQPVRSLALSFWTTAATETAGAVNLPSFDAPLTAGDSDTTFTLFGFTRSTPPVGKVYAIVEDPDGRILIGGDFGQVNGVASRNVARLNPDGSIDPTFNAGLGPNGPVYALALRPDGSILVGGSFSTWNGQPSGNRLVALNASGGRESGYTAGISNGPSDAVNWLGVDASGNSMVGGRFTAPRNGIARLTANGSNDGSFNPGTGVASSTVWSGAALPGGAWLIGGDFTTVNGMTRNRIARLTMAGAVDGWNPGTGFDSTVHSIALLSGSTFAHTAGSFTTFQSAPRPKAGVVGVSDASPGLSPWGPADLNITRIWVVR